MRPHAHASSFVGIGVPVRNGEQFLRPALESLLAQSFENFEVLISDNASTDGTAELCAEFVARDRRVRYVRQERNLGLPNNWNFVAKHSRGKYFKWASANDFVAPDMLEACVQALESNHDAVLAYGRTTLVDAAGDIVGEYRGDFPLLSDSPSARYRELYEKIGMNNAIDGVVRREALLRTSLLRRYPVSDFVLLVELLLQGKFQLVSRPLFFRRIDPLSMTTSLPFHELIKLHDPSAQGDEWVTLRKHFDLVRVALTTPGLPLAERLQSVKIASEHALWARGQIMSELRHRAVPPAVRARQVRE